LTRKDIDTDMISPNDMKQYKSILKMTNAHLTRFEAGDNIKICRGLKYTEVISNVSERYIKTSLGEVLNRQRCRCLRILKICTLNLVSRLASLLYVNLSQLRHEEQSL
jgi:hypothetical protein